jgi:hypothetical protein
MTQHADLERAIAVYRDGEPNDAARLAVNVMAAVA